METVFTDSEVEVLKDNGTLVSYSPGRTIYFMGEPADYLYYILKGRVRVFSANPAGKEVTLDVVEAGHVFGESVFEKDGFRPANVQAVTRIEAISLKFSQLQRIFEADPRIAVHMMQFCSDSMNRLSTRLVEQCMLDRFGKVAGFVLDITETDSKEKGTEGGRIPYTHEELSTALGLSRPTVSSILKDFEKKGWIEKYYRYFVVKDREALTAFIEAQKDS